MLKLFTRHPATVNESYWQHFRSALGFSMRLFVAAVACFLHAVFPFLLTRAGSDIIRSLHHRMVEARRRQAGGSDCARVEGSGSRGTAG